MTSIGQRVELKDGRIGVVRWIGIPDFSTGDWIGVELLEPSGKNDGAVQGQRYFDCAPNHGVFLRPSGIGEILKPTAADNGAAAPKPRPSSVHTAANGARRQTLLQDRRTSVTPGTPTPAGRVASGIRSPTKSPTKQLGLTNTSVISTTSRTATPPAAAKRPLSIVAAKPRPSIAGSATRKTSTLPAAPTRTTRPSIAAAGSSRAPPQSRNTAVSARSSTSARSAAPAPPARPTLRKRLSAAKESTALDDASEDGNNNSIRERRGSISQDGTDDTEEETPRPNFAPPSAPPIPPEPAENLARSRRLSSATAASVQSQRTIRSGAASNRHVEELEGKLRILERKQMDDRELREQLEKALSERDRFKSVIEKLQVKYKPQQQELEKLKREWAQLEEKAAAIETIQAEHEMAMEHAVLDRECAEQDAEGYKRELMEVRAKNEGLELELEIEREEKIEMERGLSPEEQNSAGRLQLERTIQRYRNALIQLRDTSQDTEAGLRAEIAGLEKQADEMDGLKKLQEEMQEKLQRSEDVISDLRQQLEAQDDSESIIESLQEANTKQQKEINELRAAKEELDNLGELNDEVIADCEARADLLQVQLQQKENELEDCIRTFKEQQKKLDEADYNLGRYREYVTTLQGDFQDLRASKQISETEAAQLSNKSRAMMDLNRKLQSSAAKTQVKAIDLDLQKLDAEQATEHLHIVQRFLPEAFKTDRDSVHALLRFKRIGYKANLVQKYTKERIATFGTRGEDEGVFAACDALEKLTMISAMSDRLVKSIRGCSPEAFVQYGSALYELEVVERTLDVYIHALRRDELNESEMPVRLGRSVDVMTHLSSLYLRDGPTDLADELMMKTTLLQSQLESATSALTVTQSLMEANIPHNGDHDGQRSESDDPESPLSDDQKLSVSASFALAKALKIIIDQVRNAKVVSNKTYRAISDLQASSLTLNETFLEQFEAAEEVANTIVDYTCRSGATLQALFNEEGRLEEVTASDVAESLVQVARSTGMVASPRELEVWSPPHHLLVRGPYTSLAIRISNLVSRLESLATLPTDLDNTVEFERAPQPWVARAEELKRTKITSIGTEAELARTLEAVNERDSLLKQKDKELDEASVRTEMLEARMRDASKRTAKIAELEGTLREARDSEAKIKKESARLQLEAQQDVERARQEIARLGESRRSNGTGAAGLNNDAMGAGTIARIDRADQRMAAMSSALRHVRESNVRLRLPTPDAPISVVSQHQWLYEALDSLGSSVKIQTNNTIERIMSFSTLSPPVDLTKAPKDKLAWRPIKESARLKIEMRKEEWIDWKELPGRLGIRAAAMAK